MRYCWLVDTINNRGPISFAEIARRWENYHRSDHKPLALRTFHNHRRAVESLFDISIVHDKNYNYYIENSEELQKNRASAWLLNAFSISNILDGAQSLGNRVQLEDMPSSQRHLADLLDAMRENQRVEILYHPYHASEPFALTLQPLIVKSHERRWYLYANKPDDPQIKLYALDRIIECKLLTETFTCPKDFDPESYTYNTYGVTIYDDTPPVTIRIRAKGRHAKYMRSLPLHRSQREVETTDKYADFEFYVSPTNEFCDKLLSFNTHIEVLSPTSVRLKMHNLITNMSHIYSEAMLRTKVGKAVIYAAQKFSGADMRKIGVALECCRGTQYIHNLDACLIYLEAKYGWSYIKSICLNDADTLALFESGETEDIFAFSSEHLRETLRKGVKSIDDLVQITIDYHHPKAQPIPYDHALTQALIAYFGAFIKCHYPHEYEIFFSC